MHFLKYTVVFFTLELPYLQLVFIRLHTRYKWRQSQIYHSKHNVCQIHAKTLTWSSKLKLKPVFCYRIWSVSMHTWYTSISGVCLKTRGMLFYFSLSSHTPDVFWSANSPLRFFTVKVPVKRKKRISVVKTRGCFILTHIWDDKMSYWCFPFVTHSFSL